MKSIYGQSTTKTLKRAIGAAFFAALFLPMCVAAQKKAAAELQFRQCWEYRYDGVAEAKVATDGASVFMVRDASVVEAVSVEAGKMVWSSDVGGTVDSNLIVTGGDVILIRRVSAGGEATAAVVALSVATGVTKWSAAVESGENFTLIAAGRNVIVIARDGTISSFSDAGTANWTKRITSGMSTAPIMAGGDIFFVSETVSVSSIAAAGGESAALTKAQFAVTALASPYEGILVWGDERGIVSSLSAGSGKMGWQFKSGAAISSLVRADGLLIAASNDNFIYALSPFGGRRVWKKRFSGRIQSVTPLNDDTVLIGTVGERVVQLLYLKNGRSAGQIVLRDDELPVASVALSRGNAAVLSDAALYLYGNDGCSLK